MRILLLTLLLSTSATAQPLWRNEVAGHIDVLPDPSCGDSLYDSYVYASIVGDPVNRRAYARVTVDDQVALEGLYHESDDEVVELVNYGGIEMTNGTYVVPARMRVEVNGCVWGVSTAGSMFWSLLEVPGDSNDDEVFDSSDLVLAFSGGKYETGGLAHWSEGDWNVDGLFDSTDLVEAFSAGLYDDGTGMVPVPEPTCLWPLLGLLALRSRIGE